MRDAGEVLELGVARLAELRQPGRIEVDRRHGRARHERVAVPVDDRAALRWHGDLARLVRVRARCVLRAGENLQRPEPHHERRKADEEKRAEDREPARELRRDAIWLDGGLALGVRGVSRPAARASCGGTSQGAAPPR